MTSKYSRAGGVRESLAYLSSNQSADLPYSGTVNGLTNLIDIDVRDMRRIMIQVKPGANPLTGFEVHAQSATDADFVPFLAVASDYTSPQGILIGASGDLTTLAANTAGWLLMDVSGIATLRLKANGTNAPLAVKWGAN
jgi:hypothetical protein